MGSRTFTFALTATMTLLSSIVIAREGTQVEGHHTEGHVRIARRPGVDPWRYCHPPPAASA
jgi:hypothetical protein